VAADWISARPGAAKARAGGAGEHNKRLQLPAGPAGTTLELAAVRCRCNIGLSGGASLRPLFGGTSAAVAGGPAAAETQSR